MKTEPSRAKDYHVSNLRRPRGGSRQVLRFCFRELEHTPDHTIRRSRAGTPGKRHDRDLRIGRAEVPRAQSWVSLQVHRRLSLSVECQTQEEVDRYWKKLGEGGEPGPCDWLKDRFGLSWQINPRILGEMLNDPAPEKAKRVIEAMLKMSKISIENLKRAYQGN